MATAAQHISRWLYLVDPQCYGIGHYKDNAWWVVIPMCYASFKVIERARDYIREDTIAVEMVLPGETPDRQVITGNPVVCVVEYPAPVRIEHHGHIREAFPGKITINGLIVYGVTMHGGHRVWTPVRPDMGEVDIYSGAGVVEKLAPVNFLADKLEGKAE